MLMPSQEPILELTEPSLEDQDIHHYDLSSFGIEIPVEVDDHHYEVHDTANNQVTISLQTSSVYFNRV